MKTITKYQADDGTEFKTPEGAEKHDTLCHRIAVVLAQFGPEPAEGANHCDFANGSGYLGHGPTVVRAVRAALLGMATEYSDHRWIKKAMEDPTVDESWPGRIIGECCPEPLCSAWHRIACCDSQGREWGQPYFAKHPSEAKQINLKKTPHPKEA